MGSRRSEVEILRQINRETPRDKELHLICDNYATHKHPNVQESHPRQSALKFQTE